mmetsp:Transcript_17860/g.26735  ORF Transcript_17860/g.26735 Transcript_17860/m.26735 type:complete len:514 (+) Transcript_17860:113-1654(+)
MTMAQGYDAWERSFYDHQNANADVVQSPQVAEIEMKGVVIDGRSNSGHSPRSVTRQASDPKQPPKGPMVTAGPVVSIGPAPPSEPRSGPGIFAPRWEEGKSFSIQSPGGGRKTVVMPKKNKVWVTYIITLTQAIIAILQLTGTPVVPGSLAPWGLGIYEEQFRVPLFSGNQTLVVQKAENPYYGPKTERILEWGAKYAPCMRDSIENDRAESIKQSETRFGCCKLDGECGMMNSSTCASFGGTFDGEGIECSSCNIVLRPCCYGVIYQCSVQRKEYCSALDGHFNEDVQTCGESNCLNSICGMGANEDPGQAPNQAWRFFLPIMLHAGLIHAVLNLLVQLQLGGELEKVSGWWRFTLMYFGSGIGGNIFAAVFVPDQISVGASSAIYGLFGVDFVLLFHFWKITENKFSSLCCSIISTILYLGVGTLPWIDNWAHFGGFLTGLLLGNILLPFFSWSGWKRRTGFIVSLILFILGLITMLSYFYTNQEPEFCSWCKYVSCIPYTDGLCDSQEAS